MAAARHSLSDESAFIKGVVTLPTRERAKSGFVKRHVLVRLQLQLPTTHEWNDVGRRDNRISDRRRLRQVQRKVNINNTANRRITRAMAVYVTSLCASSEEREGGRRNERTNNADDGSYMTKKQRSIRGEASSRPAVRLTSDYTATVTKRG